MRDKFIHWLRQTPDRAVKNFDDIFNCPLAEFGRSLGYADAVGGTVNFFTGKERYEVLAPDETQVLVRADIYHQTFGQVADILEHRNA